MTDKDKEVMTLVGAFVLLILGMWIVGWGFGKFIDLILKLSTS